MDDVHAMLTELGAASGRLAATVAKRTDDDLRAPARLPGWTRGHLVAHLARNADSCWNLREWARTGEMSRQYPSDEVREAGVEANSGRPAGELRVETRIAIERLARQAATLPGPAWERMVAARSGWPHHAGLAAGLTCADWSPAYVRWELTVSLAASRLDGGLAAGRVRATDLDVDVRLGDGPEISAPGHELLGWLAGRGGGASGG